MRSPVAKSKCKYDSELGIPGRRLKHGGWALCVTAVLQKTAAMKIAQVSPSRRGSTNILVSPV
jgi:hypothetical protein